MLASNESQLLKLHLAIRLLAFSQSVFSRISGRRPFVLLCSLSPIFRSIDPLGRSPIRQFRQSSAVSLMHGPHDPESEVTPSLAQ